MEDLLANPVYYSLLYNDSHLGAGKENVCWFDEQVSPFAGFDENDKGGFEKLYKALPAGRKILFATPATVTNFNGWHLRQQINGLQFVFDTTFHPATSYFKPTPLGKEHVEEMVQLAQLTKPGPFNTRTIEFGHYHGVIDNNRLVAMTGQRLHIHDYTEVSAVCTHPDHLGNGYASTLVQHQVNFILGQGQIPFLHVREDNHRAIELYNRLGFRVTRPMNFYFLQRP